MEDLIELKDIEYNIKMVFENTLWYAHGNRIKSTDNKQISYIPKLVEERNEVISYGNWNESNEIRTILSDKLLKYEDENKKLFAVIELKKLIYDYCMNFLKSNNFYNEHFIFLYKYDNLPDLEKYSTNNKLNIHIQMIQLKDRIVYIIVESEYNFIETIDLSDFTFEKYKRESLDVWKKDNPKGEAIKLFYPYKLNFLDEEKALKRLKENDNLYFDYLIVKNLIEYFASLQFQYFKLKFNKEFEQNTNITLDMATNLCDIFNVYFNNINDFKKFLIGNFASTKINFNGTKKDLCLILSTIQGFSNVNYPAKKLESIFNFIYKKRNTPYNNHRQQKDKLKKNVIKNDKILNLLKSSPLRTSPFLKELIKGDKGTM